MSSFNTSSLSFPNMFDVATNSVAVLTDNASVVNRSRLLFLSNPTEMVNDIPFGLGLKKYIFQYNNDNVKARIQDHIKEQLAIYEPKVDAEHTSFADGLLFSGNDDPNAFRQEFNQLKMTVGLQTIYGEQVPVQFTGQEVSR